MWPFNLQVFFIKSRKSIVFSLLFFEKNHFLLIFGLFFVIMNVLWGCLVMKRSFTVKYDALAHILPGFPKSPRSEAEFLTLCKSLSVYGMLNVLDIAFADRAGEYLPELMLRRSVSLRSARKIMRDRFPDIRLQAAIALHLESVEAAIPYLNDLVIGGSRALPVLLPLGSFSIENERNYSHLLSEKALPIATNAEGAFRFASSAVCERLISLPKTAYIFTPKAFKEPDLLHWIEKLVQNEKYVLLASESNSGFFSPFPTVDMFNSAKARSLYLLCARLSESFLSHGIFPNA